jgi:hypothetical protein
MQMELQKHGIGEDINLIEETKEAKKNNQNDA